MAIFLNVELLFHFQTICWTSKIEVGVWEVGIVGKKCFSTGIQFIQMLSQKDYKLKKHYSGKREKEQRVQLDTNYRKKKTILGSRKQNSWNVEIWVEMLNVLRCIKHHPVISDFHILRHSQINILTHCLFLQISRSKIILRKCWYIFRIVRFETFICCVIWDMWKLVKNIQNSPFWKMLLTQSG